MIMTHIPCVSQCTSLIGSLRPNSYVAAVVSLSAVLAAVELGASYSRGRKADSRFLTEE